MRLRGLIEFRNRCDLNRRYDGKPCVEESREESRGRIARRIGRRGAHA